jgi:hypothetical protein
VAHRIEEDAEGVARLKVSLSRADGEGVSLVRV